MKRIVAIRDLFFSFRGRMPLQMWWVTSLMTIFFMTLVLILVIQLENANIEVGGYFIFVFLGTWLAVARDTKRLHDRNHSGKKLISYYVCLHAFLYFGSMNPDWAKQEPIVPAILLGWIIYKGVQLALLPGDKGENDYGPPPESLKVWWDRTGR